MKTPSKNLLLQIVTGVREAVMVVDVSVDKWRVVFFNPAMQRLLGFSAGEISSQQAEPLLFRIAGTAGVEALRQCSAERPQTRFESQFICANANDRHIDGEVIMLGTAKHLRAVYLSATDVADETAGTGASGSLRLLATDSVTTFLEPEPWMELLQRDAAIAAREQAWLAVIVFRVDALGAYVDTFGQHAGDSAMKRVAHSVRRRLKRAGDTAARIGNAELALLVHGSSAPMAREFAASIAADVRALAIHHPKSPFGRHITVSAGVCAEVPAGEKDALRLLQRARSQLDAPQQASSHIPGSQTAH